MRRWFERLRDAHISDDLRPLATAIAIVVVVAAGMAMLLAGGSDKKMAPTGTTPIVSRPVPTATVAPTTTATATPAPTVAPGSEVTRSTRSKLYAATRLFLRDYIPFSYGRQPADAIDGATSSLLTTLRDNAPRPVPGVTGKDAKVELVQAGVVRGDRATTRALISTGKERYVITVTLVNRGGWLVDDVGP